MDKASKAIRRSGVRLRSMSSGYGSLQMVISQLGEVRSTFKSFAQAQTQSSEDLLQWAVGTRQNRAIEETIVYLAELAALWGEVQKDFADQLKEYRTQFELILEGEKHVSQAREILSGREQREAKLRREMKKVSKKAPAEEVRVLKEKLTQAERATALAHHDVVERVSENEAVKMIRVKEGLVRMGMSYCDLAQRCLILFTAHQAIAAEIPDVHDKDLHDIKYTGGNTAKKLMQDAKDQVRHCQRSSLTPKAPLPEDPPPPYTPSVEHLDNVSPAVQEGNARSPDPSVLPVRNHLIPSAPSASIDSFSPQHSHGPNSQARDGLPGYSHATRQLPGVQNVSPAPPQDTPPHQPSTPHANSAPNLAEENMGHTFIGFSPFNSRDNSSFNETPYYPDATSSSPNLASSRYQETADSEVNPPYNPDYEWLPCGRDRQGTQDNHGTEPPPSTAKITNGISGNQNVAQKVTLQDKDARGCAGKVQPHCVYPKVGRNPFLDSDTDSDEDGGGGGDRRLAEALKRTSIS